MKSSNLSQAVKLALLSAGTTALASSPVIAQEEVEEIEEIITTGSRLVRTDLEAVSPLQVVDNEEFTISGIVNVEQKLNELPSILPSFGPSSNNPGDGTARVDLRGLGTRRTLVLVNGRRFVPSTQSGVVDLNTIPGTLIKQVDVVTGGASAVYGSDALAGVVNFQMVDDFEGVEIGGLYDVTTEGDAEKYTFDITLGGNFDSGKGNAVVYASYTKREALFQGDRDFSAFSLEDVAPTGTPGQDPKTGLGGPLGPAGSAGVPGTRTFSSNCNDPADPLSGADYLCINGPGGTPGAFPLGLFDENGGALPWINSGPNTSRFNYAPDNYLQLPQERYVISAMAHYDITDSVTAYTELTYANNKVPQELAPTPAFTGYLEVNPDSPFFGPEVQAALDLIRSDTNGDGIIDDTDNANLGFIGRRMVENGSRQALDTRNAFRLLVGFRGDFNDNWGWDAYYSNARLTGNNLLNNDVSATRFKQAVLVTDDGLSCQDTSGGCQPLNIFGPGNISDAAIGFINVGAANITEIEYEVISATITGQFGGIGDAGPIGVAIGAERRDDNSEFRPDAFLSAGDVMGFNAGQPTIGGYDVTDVFAEIDIPLIAGKPGFESLSIWAAARSSDYSNLDSTVTTYATALNWAPIDQLRLRAGYQRAIRAPNVLELFGGQAQGFPGATDPCSVDGSAAGTAPGNAVYDLCAATGVPPANIGVFAQANSQIEGLFGGNPNLEQEESDTYTFGAVIQPTDNLDITIDYFDISVEDAISVLGNTVGGLLDICYNQTQDENDQFCQAVFRRPDGNVQQASVLNANIGFIETQGIDLAVNWVMDMDAGIAGDGSSLAVNFRSTFLDAYDVQPVATLPAVNECAGTHSNSTSFNCGRPRPEELYNTRVTWSSGPLTLSMLWRYIGSTEVDSIPNGGVDPATLSVPETDAQNYVDLSAAYQFTDAFRLNVGIKNLFDEAPNHLGDEQNEANTWTGSYDIIGPRVFVSGSYTFE
jgi:outer membrane receptor protein involved in Fe transport